jgi:hypothetical protein
MKIDEGAIRDLVTGAGGESGVAVTVLHALRDSLVYVKRIDSQSAEEKAVAKILRLLGSDGYESLVRAALRELAHYMPACRAEIIEAAATAVKAGRGTGKGRKIAELAEQLRRPEVDEMYVAALVHRVRRRLRHWRHGWRQE